MCIKAVKLLPSLHQSIMIDWLVWTEWLQQLRSSDTLAVHFLAFHSVWGLRFAPGKLMYGSASSSFFGFPSIYYRPSCISTNPVTNMNTAKRACACAIHKCIILEFFSSVARQRAHTHLHNSNWGFFFHLHCQHWLQTLDEELWWDKQQWSCPDDSDQDDRSGGSVKMTCPQRVTDRIISMHTINTHSIVYQLYTLTQYWQTWRKLLLKCRNQARN